MIESKEKWYRITFERQERLRSSFSEDQDHSSSKFLLRDYMADNSRRAKKTYTMNQSISHIKQKVSSRTVSRNHSTSNKTSLNYQGRKKKSQLSCAVQPKQHKKILRPLTEVKLSNIADVKLQLTNNNLLVSATTIVTASWQYNQHVFPRIHSQRPGPVTRYCE